MTFHKGGFGTQYAELPNDFIFQRTGGEGMNEHVKSGKPTILVVDDDQDTCEMMRIILESRGLNCQVMIALSGQEALALHRSGEHKIVLFVTDNTMDARMSGIRFLATLRHSKDPTPVVMVTADPRASLQRDLEGLNLEERSLDELGLNGLFRKPVDFDPLVDTIRKLLPKA